MFNILREGIDMDKTVYATDGNYFLVPLSETEKENYLSISRENGIGYALSDNERYEELLWSNSFSKDKRYFSIYDTDEVYCGNIELNRIDTPTPEIGIELLKKHRNKGIAGQAIRLLARTAGSELIELEYYILRVSAGNLHSKHMIEKLGSVCIGKEDSIAVETLKRLIDYFKKEKDEKVYEKYSKMLEALQKDEKEKILVYKLTSYYYANE